MMNSRIATAATLAATFATGFAANAQTTADQSLLNERGAIMMLGSNVHLHTNAAHAEVGYRGFTLSPSSGLHSSRCYLTVLFDHDEGERIVNISATPDDKMVQQGITVGTAGGNGKVYIRLYRGGKAVCASDRSIASGTNIWLSTTSIKSA